ncbi:MAG: DUF3343 domain-containing protein [Clostridia bacterium]|nr:DUF3343 domain-containing protein [Clostridia bacterium]MBQ9482424.1 DUF3343 domain-containing protein [Clostridia bacterium]
MNEILAVFRSRTQTRIFAEAMRESGVRCQVVQTPAEARIGCGISAKFFARDKRRAEAIIRGYRLNSFNGFYEVFRITGRTAVKKIF